MIRQDASKQNTFIELQQSTFNLFLAFISLCSATVIWLANIHTRSSPLEVVALWMAVEVICLISWWLRQKHLRAAIYVALAGLWVCNALAAHYLDQPFFFIYFR